MFLRRVGPARFQRRPTLLQSLEIPARNTRNPTQREPEWQNDEAQNDGRGPQAHRPPGMMILRFIILPNPRCRNSSRPAKKRNVRSRVGRRGEARLVPPDIILPSFKETLALDPTHPWLAVKLSGT